MALCFMTLIGISLYTAVCMYQEDGVDNNDSPVAFGDKVLSLVLTQTALFLVTKKDKNSYSLVH